MNKELKPCPFCGGEANTYPVVVGRHLDHTLFSVSCKKCGCGTKRFDWIREAIAAWNKRAKEAGL